MSRLCSTDLPKELKLVLEKQSCSSSIVFYKGSVPGLRSGAGKGFAVEVKLFVSPPELCALPPKKKMRGGQNVFYAEVFDPRAKSSVKMRLDDLLRLLPSWNLPAGGLLCTGKRAPSFLQEALLLTKEKKGDVKGIEALVRYSVNQSAANKQHVDKLAQWFCFDLPWNLELKANIIFGWPMKNFFQKSITAGRTIPTVWKRVCNQINSFPVLCDTEHATKKELEIVFGKDSNAERHKSAKNIWVITSSKKAEGTYYVWPKGMFFHSDIASETDAANLLLDIGAKAGSFLFWKNVLEHVTLSYIDRDPSMARVIHAGSIESKKEPGVLNQNILAKLAFEEVKNQTIHWSGTGDWPEYCEQGKMAKRFGLKKGIYGNEFYSVKAYGPLTTSIKNASDLILSNRGLSLLMKKDVFISDGILFAQEMDLNAVLPGAFSNRLRSTNYRQFLDSTESGRKFVAKALREEGIVRREIRDKLAKMNVASFDPNGTAPPCILKTLYPDIKSAGKLPTYVDRANVVLVLKYLFLNTGAIPTNLGVDFGQIESHYDRSKKVQSGKELMRELKDVPKVVTSNNNTGYRCTTISNKNCLCPYNGNTGLCADAGDIEDFTFISPLQRCMTPKKKISKEQKRRDSTI